MKKTLVAIAAVLASAALSFAQPKAPEAFKPMGDSISNYLRNNTLVRSRVSVKDVVQGKKTLDIYLSDGISDFPIRDKKVILHVRRRRWKTPDGKTVSRDWDLKAQGTRMSKDFAGHLKKIFGHIPDYGPLS